MSIIIGADLVPTESNRSLFESGDVQTLLGKDLAAYLRQAEYRVFNLETALTDQNTPTSKCGPNLSASTKTAKTPTYDSLGYQYIIVRGENKSKAYRVHRLVAEAFLPNYDEHLIIDHLNGIRDDNRVENLCVKTQTENLAARDERNAPLYQELRRLIMTYGYDETLEILQQF